MENEGDDQGQPGAVSSQEQVPSSNTKPAVNNNPTAPGRSSYTQGNPYNRSAGQSPNSEPDRSGLQQAEENGGGYNPSDNQAGASEGGSTSNTGEPRPDRGDDQGGNSKFDNASQMQQKEQSPANHSLYNGGNGGGVYDQERDQGSPFGNAGKTRNKEQSSGKPSLYNGADDPGNASLYKSGGEQDRRFGRARDGIQNARARLGKLAKKKWFIGASVGGGGGVVLLITLLFLLIGALKIPDFAQHITAYEFSRVTREYAKSAEITTVEDLSVQATDDGIYKSLQKKYATVRGNTWGKLDKYRPGIVASNLESNNNLKFIYKRSGIVGRRQLVGMTFDNQTYLKKPLPKIGRYVPVLKDVLKIQNDAEFSKRIFPVISASLDDNNIGPIIRGTVANDLRKQAGISLIAWANQARDYAGKSEDQARLQQARDAEKAINEAKVEDPTTGPLKDATDKIAAQEQADIKNDSTLQKILAKGGVDPGVSQILNDAFSSSTVATFLKFINPAVSIGMPVCIVYDGSLERSGPTIDAQTTEEMRSYYYVASAADQQKYGQTNGQAVGAMNDKLGDITQSNAEARASGGVVNTANTLSTEASAGGQYTVLDALLPSGVASFLDTAGNTVCPVITNTYFVVGSGLVQLLAALASGGLSAGGEEAASEGASSIIGFQLERLLSSFVGDKTGAVAGKVGDILGDTASTGGKIAAATIAAKLVVMGYANGLHNGLEQNTDFTNEADAGGNFTANQLDQNMNYGRPLTTPETTQSNQQSTQDLADQERAKSLLQRYADIHDPNSLVDRLAIMSSAYLKPSIVSSLVSFGSRLFNPLKGLASMLRPLVAPAAFADTSSNNDTANYGNVQFGWSQQEENLIDSSDSYKPLENQYILDQNAGQEDKINSTYGKCFTGSVGTLLSGSDNNSNPAIVRDEHGNVISDKGLCSPENLGYKSTDPLATDNSADTPQRQDLIFRWRLAHRYSNTIDQLANEQNVN